MANSLANIIDDGSNFSLRSLNPEIGNIAEKFYTSNNGLQLR